MAKKDRHGGRDKASDIARHYDAYGHRQDRHRWYEDMAFDVIAAKGRFEEASSVFELGPGTGRLAERLLRDHLPQQARYAARDISARMIALARRRLEPLAGPGRLDLAIGTGIAGENPHDRIVATFVLDLMNEAEARDFIGHGLHALAPDGLLCLASIARGHGVGAWLSHLWAFAHRLSPASLGHCRPIRLETLLDKRWRVFHYVQCNKFGLVVDIILAGPSGDKVT